ncbi:MAG: polynucleotide adenylyltransferase PcnB [Gammaproteobacteria bacterium]
MATASYSPTETHIEPRIIPRPEHCITRADISDNALKVLYRLKDGGYAAYLVGGGVRDLLLGLHPKDFDVATDARPEQVRALFRNCRLIGRRFRLAHILFGRNIVEVATFRALLGEDTLDDDKDISFNESGRIVRDNVYGTLEQDAVRRDFTVNALYYNIADFSVVDYVDGMHDLEARTLRLIGEPRPRYHEDPVRMLRAVRFATKLDFEIEPEALGLIGELAPLLRDIPPARLFDEVLKLFHGGRAVDTFEALRQHRLFEYLFPATGKGLDDDQDGYVHALITSALRNTDERIGIGKPVTPAFLYAVMLWPALHARADRYEEEEGMRMTQALATAAREVIHEQTTTTSIPRRFGGAMMDIWLLQPRFLNRRGKRALSLLTHPRFRAAYDFMCLRASVGEPLDEQCEWWTQIQEVSPGEQRQMASVSGRGRRPRKRPAGRQASG